MANVIAVEKHNICHHNAGLKINQEQYGQKCCLGCLGFLVTKLLNSFCQTVCLCKLMIDGGHCLGNDFCIFISMLDWFSWLGLQVIVVSNVFKYWSRYLSWFCPDLLIVACFNNWLCFLCFNFMLIYRFLWLRVVVLNFDFQLVRLVIDLIEFYRSLSSFARPAILSGSILSWFSDSSS